MEVKPGYKQTEVGVIPEEWDEKPLNEGIKLLSGHHVLAQHCNTEGKGTPYITGPADFPDGSIKNSKFTEKPTTICRKEDILLTVKGSGAGTIVLADGEYCISRQLMAVRVTEWDTAYVYASLRRDASLFGAAATGLIPGLSRGDILNKRIPVPPLREQRAIAGALSDVDALIGALDQLIAKKRDLKQAAMQQLLTGRKRLPGFHGEWEVTRLGEIGEFKNGINKSKEAFGHGSPFVNLMDVFGFAAISTGELLGLINSTDFEQKTYDLRSGDVIFIRSSVKPSGVGLTTVIENDLPKTVYSGFLIRFRDGGLLDLDFKKHCFCEEGFRKKVIGSSSVSANTNINQDNLKRLSIPLPPTKAEQTAIAEVLSDMDAELATLTQRRDKTRALKQGMMQELLTGRIRLV